MHDTLLVPVRRRGAILAILAWVLLLQTAACRDERDLAAPNILLILADDFSTGHLSARPDVVPTLAALAHEGVRFPNGLVSVARCGPTRAAVAGGLLPRRSGMYFNHAPAPVEFDHEHWLAALLRRNGYRTFMGGTFPGNAAAASFDVIDPGSHFARGDQQSLLDFLERGEDDRPWFVWYGPRLPHTPHDPPAAFLERVDPASIEIPDYVDPARADEYRDLERRLLATEAWFDDRVHEVLDRIDRLGQLDDTLVVFLDDNGYANGLVSKGSPYEAGLRVPVVFWSRRRLPAGELRPEWIRDVDVFATILDYAGVEPPNEVGEGSADLDPPARSIRPLLGTPGGSDPAWPNEHLGLAYPKNATTGVWWRDAFAIHLREGRYKYVRWLRDVREEANRELGIRHPLTEFPRRDSGDEELFDLETDPFEQRNRIDDPALDAIRRRLAERVDRFVERRFR